MPFVGGNVITLALNVVRAVMKRKSIATTMSIVLGKHSFELATFLGVYGGVFKVFMYLKLNLNIININFIILILTYFMNIYNAFYVDLKLISCILRGISGANRPLIVAAPAGFFAGLTSMALYGSNSISIYTAWKTIDVRVLKSFICSIS